MGETDPHQKGATTLSRGAQYLTGEKLKVVWAYFSTLSQAVCLLTKKMHGMRTAISEVENSAQGFILLADRRKDGWTDGRTDGWTDGRTDGPMR